MVHDPNFVQFISEIPTDRVSTLSSTPPRRPPIPVLDSHSSRSIVDNHSHSSSTILTTLDNYFTESVKTESSVAILREDKTLVTEPRAKQRPPSVRRRVNASSRQQAGNQMQKLSYGFERNHSTDSENASLSDQVFLAQSICPFRKLLFLA
ncbi:unnamed protein product [Protopolystoma xenopodis]|uniref:Uncharacterized protein n=1 Tax=Protopolystoma xenopodis TaxID=117903 RepID=A0A3S5AHS4_9PLAT|nr:unnamed protein product [Protopolystoma xenopodis]